MTRTDRAGITRRILQQAEDLGFACAGVCEALPSRYGDAVRRWIDEGRHGSMTWLAEDLDVRLDPRRLLPGARSVLCVADRYAGPHADPIVSQWPPRGRIARYARGDDYHVVIRDRLRRLSATIRREHPGHDCRICCDLLPIVERELAARAGIGRVGKHTLLIESGGTSYLLLGEIVTTLELEFAPDTPGDPCGTCTRCIDACPTQAIAPYRVDASRCLSFTTIEHRGTIDDAFWTPTGDWLFGCDICQEVCPHTAPTRRKRALPLHPEYAPHSADFDLFAVLGWSETDRLAATIRSALRRARLDMLKRNALICLANVAARGHDESQRAAIRARIAAIAEDESEAELVRTTAAKALQRVTTAVKS